MKRSGGLQQRKGSAFIYEAEKNAFWKAKVIKNTENWNQRTEREFNSQVLDASILSHRFPKANISMYFHV